MTNTSTPGLVSAEAAADYIRLYILRYRQEYERFCAPPPLGANYPRLPISCYLDAPSLTCYLARDGAAVVDLSREPTYDWAVGGGPALLVDEDPTRTPEWVRQLIRSAGLEGQNIGLYRVVSSTPVPENTWTGRLPTPSATATVSADATAITVHSLPMSWATLLERLSFGAFGPILDLRLPALDAPYWTPRIIRNLGIATADRIYKRFFRYLELLRHVNEPAWDIRSIPARVAIDVRRDFAWAALAASRPGATVSFDDQLQTPIDILRRDRLEPLHLAIAEMETLLDGQDQNEAVFHDYLKQHPILLDVYAEAISKPRWRFRLAESPLEKEYVEPDFVLRYPDHRYALVELERPGHSLATSAGHPTAAVTHAAFQIAEWRDYIAHQYDLLKDDYPDIAADCPGMVIISRQTQSGFDSPGALNRYLTLVRRQLTADVITYDGLLVRARTALTQLSSLV